MRGLASSTGRGGLLFLPTPPSSQDPPTPATSRRYRPAQLLYPATRAPRTWWLRFGIQLALHEYECDSQKPQDGIGDDLPVVAEMPMFVCILVSHLVFCLPFHPVSLPFFWGS